MKIKRDQDRVRSDGSDKTFTGSVEQTLLHSPVPPARTISGLNTFSPGARTVWHTHPLGQILYVVSGVGRVQVWGEPAQEIRAGDTVWFAPGEKHWHGASPDESMAHVSIQEMENGSAVTWLEPVTDDQYRT